VRLGVMLTLTHELRKTLFKEKQRKKMHIEPVVWNYAP